MTVVFIGFITSSCANRFYVGGEDGWVEKPSETYTHWAARNRFQINDTLVFKYKKGEDSVLVVDEMDYDACNISKPKDKMEDGYSTFVLERSGPMFFISGVPGKCRNGQKLCIVVIASRDKKGTPYQPPSIAPAASPVASPAHSPAAETPSASYVLSVSGASVVMGVIAVLLGLF
ncbi:hypothetical protein J5N97_025967 [Dioscorea zingiberensis]|uniref:Phytocyanin domain-containing protein n=1 Tax=Dioscorea zingiberensis TaxID=325984 RepID=A0A9D5C1Q7_9LILI|nr:hypothetical protein J5N97_025967 [Dioscorea zingiberensis]